MADARFVGSAIRRRMGAASSHLSSLHSETKLNEVPFFMAPTKPEQLSAGAARAVEAEWGGHKYDQSGA